MPSCLIVGGGVVGLSIAYELARRNWSVTVLDRRQPGREASWAGAGILPPANRATARHPLDVLRGLSFATHREWADRLLAETGIDNGFQQCGGIYLARTAGEAAALAGLAEQFRDEEIPVERLRHGELASFEPALARSADRFRAALWLPTECQLRNPRHLRALAAACQHHGVVIEPDVEMIDARCVGGKVTCVETTRGERSADQVCFSAGAWTAELLKRLGVSLGILPIRGQMLLFRAAAPLLGRILNDGPRYLVPRDDGRILVGSTEEEVGFDKRTTESGIADLIGFACDVLPALRDTPLENAWAGLRPGVYDGMPYLGRLPGLANAFVAAGHFRSGLYLSTGTALVMADLIGDGTPPFSLEPFRPSRG
jgi:glycine oxidase